MPAKGSKLSPETREKFRQLRIQEWAERKQPLEERFWSKVDIRGSDDCWPWKMACDKKMGYGQFRIKPSTTERSRAVKAHRVAFFLTHGYWPEPQCRHTCDNPPCCNPAHLREGTAQDNWDDVFKHRVERFARKLAT